MHYINGLWHSEGGAEFVSTNPATGAVLWKGRAATPQQVTAAVAAASQAFAPWTERSYEQRYAIVAAFKQAVEAQKEELALLIAQEVGKALWDARAEAASVCAKLGFSDQAYHERTGVKTISAAGYQSVTRHRPHGVMAVYGPYNFPAHLPNGHITPALLAGNTVVFKPSELTPLVAEWVMKRWVEAGIPPGVLNLVQGERDTGVALAQADVQGILFTGSSATGKLLHAQMAGRPEILLALEMGGNNPLIVSAISDVSAAVYETIMSAYMGSGQRCTCARRLIVVDSPLADAFIAKLVEVADSLVVDAYDADTDPFMGPLISMKEAERLLAAQAELEAIGGRVLLRMISPRPGLPFVTPAIIDMTGVDNVPDVEYFGPLLKLHRVASVEEALREANNTQFGLSAAVLTEDAAEYQYLSSRLRAGLVNWNKQTTGAAGSGPFGGLGVSGNHRPAGYYAADYCAYPAASVEVEHLQLPAQLAPGVKV